VDDLRAGVLREELGDTFGRPPAGHRLPVRPPVEGDEGDPEPPGKLGLGEAGEVLEEPELVGEVQAGRGKRYKV
jgi:hypothetical protein